MAKAVAAADPAELAAAYRGRDGDGRRSTAPPVPLEDDDLIVTETPRAGWAVASGGGLTVALDLTADAGAARGPGWPARWSGWSRTPGRPAGWRSATGSR